jgi:hypothetical protein
VGNAVPDSRQYEEVKLAKEMGANAIRCAHYPRNRAFYDACDEIGMLCEPELPSWGGSITSYPDIFWERMDSCARAMVMAGFNHPSIILWGIFNEAAGNFPAQFGSLHATLKNMDSTRFTAVVNNKTQTANRTTDVYGINYGHSLPWSGALFYNAEFHEGWIYSCFRGDTVGATTTENCFAPTCHIRTEDDYAEERYALRWVRDIERNTGDNRPLAGGHMWCFVDYWTPGNVGDHPMGVLDHYRIPKKVYYTFRSHWSDNKEDDYPQSGLTPTAIRLEADVTELRADSTDLSRIIGSVRDASGRCVWSSAPITFSTEGPADVFEGNPVIREAVAGKIAIILKSRLTPGTITVTARSGDLTPATITLSSVMPDNSKLPFIWTESSVERNRPVRLREMAVRSLGRSVLSVDFGMPPGGTEEIYLLSVQGRRVACPVVRSPASLQLMTAGVVPGVYRVVVETAERRMNRAVVIVR